jgi:predicted DNA-binding transcriptional regulator AlpA
MATILPLHSVLFGEPSNCVTISPEVVESVLRVTSEPSNGVTVPSFDGVPGQPRQSLFDDWVNQKQLASTLNVTPRTIRRMVARRELPAPVSMGRNIMWSLNLVNAFQLRRAERAEKTAAECGALKARRRN